MSRIGKKVILIPAGVKLQLKGDSVSADGPKGHLEQKLPADVKLELSENTLRVLRLRDDRQGRRQQGLTRALLANMVTGVERGFEKVLLIGGVGYRAETSSGQLVLSLGFSHKINLPIPRELDVKVENSTRVIIRGADKCRVGQMAATIRSLRRADPYKAKGITYEGEKIIRKAGKKTVTQQ